jgi:muconolactone D-isomerase
MEYLVSRTPRVPDGTPPEEVDSVRAREAVNSRRLAEGGCCCACGAHLWDRGSGRTLGLFTAPDAARLEDLLSAVPLRVWRSDEVPPLTPHPERPRAGCRRCAGRLPGIPVAFALSAPESARTQALVAGHLDGGGPCAGTGPTKAPAAAVADARRPSGS